MNRSRQQIHTELDRMRRQCAQAWSEGNPNMEAIARKRIDTLLDELLNLRVNAEPVT